MSKISVSLVNPPPDLTQAQVVAMTGQEGLSQLFSYQVEILHPREIDLSASLCNVLVVKIEGDHNTGRFFHGHISEFTGLGAEGHYYRYQFMLIPGLWFLSQNRQCRIYQSRDIKDIIKDVLGDDIVVEWSIQGSNPTIEYCVQYMESDLNFICRLLEDQGWYYFFRHSAENHMLVITDSGEAHQSINEGQPMGWDPWGIHQNTFSTWHPRTQWRLNATAARYFEFSRAMTREAGLLHARTGEEDDGVWLDYPADVDSPEAAMSKAMLRKEILQSGMHCFMAKTQMPTMAAGGSLTFTAPNDDTKPECYVVSEIGFQIRAETFTGGTCNTQFHCQAVLHKEHVAFRASGTALRPVISGTQTALVAGKTGESLSVDRYGRIKVQFHWDSRDNTNNACSCWVRVSQLIAGDKWGSLFLPRPGQEVVVTFLDGDPQQPLVIGCVYNAGMPPPHALPQQNTRSGFRSQSYGEKSVKNELRFDDKAGSEQLLLRAGRNKDVYVAHDALEWVGNDRHCWVKGKSYRRIEGDEHQCTHGHRISAIGKDSILQIKGKSACKVGKSMTLEAGKLDVKSGSNLTLEAGSTITLKAGSSTLVLGPSGISLDGVMINITAKGLVNINSGKGGQVASAQSPAVVEPTSPNEADDGSS